MKIGFVIYGSLETLSGGFLYDRKLVEYLRAHGDTVEIISLPWRDYAAHLTDNLSFRLPGTLDLVIEDELNHPSLIGANRKPHPYPIISLVHHLRSSELRPAWQNRFYRWVERRYLKSVDGFIFNSRTTQNVARGLIAYDRPSVVAYPPTDRFGEAITADEIRQRAYREPLRVLFLGNVIFRKGLHTLIEAILHRQLEVIVDVVGSLESEPAYARGVQKNVIAHGLSSIVRFHGSLAEEALAEILRQAHVLVVPSSYEGFGIVYLEGMAFGLPAIGTTAGAAGEIINDGGTGYLVEPWDVYTLAARLESLTGDRELLTNLSLNAIRRYQSQPKWDETGRRIRGFLQGFL